MDQVKFKAFLEKLAENFAPPFLPPDFVVLKPREDGSYVFSVGDRDVELGRGGEILGSGSNVGPAKRWLIDPRP